MASSQGTGLKERRIAAIALPVLAAAVFLVFALSPEVPTGSAPLCPLYRTTGLYCATCGATRAFHALSHGDLAAAFGYNPLFVVLLPPAAYLAVAAYLRLLPRAPRLPLPASWPRFLAGLGVPLLLYTLLRNLPGPAFAWLAP